MKINKIIINKYKSFQKEETIPVDSKNLFVYGENGSGKSSFYYSLKDFFQSSVEPIQMSNLRNMFLTDGGTDCFIEVEFEGGTKNILNENTKDTNTPAITDANRLKSFITYKHLLAVHNIKIDKKINVFDLLIKGVLKHFKSTFTGGIELGVLWDEVVLESKKTTGSGKDFHYKRQKKASVERKALKFNTALNALFLDSDTNIDYIAPTVNTILQKFIPELHIDFVRQTIQVNDWGGITESRILLKIKYKEEDLEDKNPQFILNEAKLSAIAISIFLGVIKRQGVFSTELKPLFLDDILIGLDNVNRVKLLTVLKEDFADFQIFITTYDRHWYEVAKLNLPDWKFIEFYKGANGPEVNTKIMTPMEKARIYFESYDFPECANNLRKECERLFKDKLLETYTFGEGIKSQVKPLKLETLIDRLKSYYEDLGLEAPNELITNLYNYKTILFNPLSHNDIDSPIYKDDLEKAFKVIEDLRSIKLPTRTLLLKKGSLFNLDLPAINYQAEIEIAKNIYTVDNNSVKSYSPVEIFFKDWIRAGVKYAEPKGIPAIAVTNSDLLIKIKESPFSIEKATNGLNTTFKDRKVAEITAEEVLKNMSLSGDLLFDILNPV
jgi:hypothetical protein